MPSENILSHFWELASIDEKTRLKAASRLLHALNQAQKQHDERRRKVKYTLLTHSMCWGILQLLPFIGLTAE